MTEHVLVVGSGRDLPARVRRAVPGTKTSVICRLEFVAKLRKLTEHTRVIAVRHDAQDEEWVALARAAHELHPFTRIATFGESDQDRCAVIGEDWHRNTLTADRRAGARQARDAGQASRNWYRLNGFRGSR